MALPVPPPIQPITLTGRQEALITLQILLLVLALITLGLRLYTRARIVRSVGLDDWVMAIAALLTTGLSLNASVGTLYGWGLHFKDIHLANIRGVLLIAWIAQLLFTTTTSMVKLSILLFYLRLLAPQNRRYRLIIYGALAFVTTWLVTFLFVIVLQCRPVADFWTPLPGTKTRPNCFKPAWAMGVHGVTNILTDLFVFVLPIPMVWGVQLPKRQRLGLVGVFAVGGVVCVAGAMRLYYSIIVNQSLDGTWLGFDLWTWEAVEVDLGMICASLPALKPLIVKIFPTLGFGSSGASYGTPSGAGGQRSAKKSLPMGVAGPAGGVYPLRSVTSSFQGGQGVGSEETLTGESLSTLGKGQKGIMVVKSFTCERDGEVDEEMALGGGPRSMSAAAEERRVGMGTADIGRAARAKRVTIGGTALV